MDVDEFLKHKGDTQSPKENHKKTFDHDHESHKRKKLNTIDHLNEEEKLRILKVLENEPQQEQFNENQLKKLLNQLEKRVTFRDIFIMIKFFKRK